MTNLHLQTAANKHVRKKGMLEPLQLCLNSLMRITVQYAGKGYGITDLLLLSNLRLHLQPYQYTPEEEAAIGFLSQQGNKVLCGSSLFCIFPTIYVME